ncbi:hypothetical protein PSF70_09895 [Methanosarcina mazei]|nr:hypothetical protein PSF70_09895 [Methanosarcina mazei]
MIKKYYLKLSNFIGVENSYMQRGKQKKIYRTREKNNNIKKHRKKKRESKAKKVVKKKEKWGLK